MVVIVALLFAACTSRPPSVGPGGTAWGVGAFDSNGQRSYFTDGWTLEDIGASSPRPVNSTEENVMSTAE
ncbi:MAG: hypothetical protein ACR2G6_11795 [Gemmatimonadaceae bacterium]